MLWANPRYKDCRFLIITPRKKRLTKKDVKKAEEEEHKASGSQR
jgi:hypothetical protein